jgi:hypothetical protein
MKTEDGRRLTVFGQRSPVSLGRRLLRDTSGQVLLLGAVLVVAILAFLLSIPNGTHVTTQKVRGQTAADVGAFTGSVWLARSLNLTASMNIGIKNVYTWMTVLTVGEALAKALYSDTLDSTVHAMGGQITLALFNSSNPLTVHSVEYPGSIRKLDTTAQWLYSLQGDITTNFSSVAATLGSQEASQNAGAYPSSQTAGGYAIVRTNNSIPMLVENTTGDSLLFDDLLKLGPALDTIPTLDPNITPATGILIIDPNTWDVWAYYSDTSLWMDRVDSFYHCYTKCVGQLFENKINLHRDTGIQYLDPGPDIEDYHHGKLWAQWVDYCGEPNHQHTPFLNTDGSKDTYHWTWLDGWLLGSNRYKFDTVFTAIHLVKRTDTASMHDQWTPAESAWIETHKNDSITMHWRPTGFYVGHESTVPIKGAIVRPRRVNPARTFHTVSYVWRQGASISPYGLGAPMGGTFFPRSAVAAVSPMLSVARSEPFMPLSSPSGAEFFFSPAWDVRLTAMDSVGVVEITSDTAYAGHTHGSFNNLEDLRKYVLLP